MFSSFNRPNGAPHGSYFESGFNAAGRINSREEYDARHRACPVCGDRQSVETTCVGMIPPDWNTAVDSNSASCKCGWRGIVHDLLP